MRSKASIKSHPLHPILVAFPVALFTGTLVFDLLALFIDDPAFLATGYNMEIFGVIMAVVAAVPGIIDFRYTVPPNSSAKRRAAKHGILNSTVLIIFFLAWMMRGYWAVSLVYVIPLEVIGVILMGIAGWMGGTLVYRNQIGVDPRYAYAGKWKELYLDESSDSIEAAEAHKLQHNQMMLLHFGEKRIVLAMGDEKLVAFDDYCTHKGGSLAGGSMICNTVQCPWHGSHFDVLSGKVKAGPAHEDIRTYPVVEKDGKVFIHHRGEASK